MAPKPIVIVQGGQWGSEGKGMVAAAVGLNRNIKYAVRTGTVNAGHTVYLNQRSIPAKMQQIPVGWVNPDTKLIIGPGAYIHPQILRDEIALINSMTGEDVRQRLYIDYRAGLHLEAHTEQAAKANRHHAIGATGKGCSAAIVDKITNRGKGAMLFHEWLAASGDKALVGLQFSDTTLILNEAYDRGDSILLEGTQGTHLDLHLGPYPYTTHKQTQAGQWALEAGLAPGLEYETLLVCRTFPIRVAGNSGPMPDETDWPTLTRFINKRCREAKVDERVKADSIRQFEQALREVVETAEFPIPKEELHSTLWTKPHTWSPELQQRYRVAVSEMHKLALELLPGPVVADLCRVFEMTTVTKKLRRVSWFNPYMLKQAVMWNRPTGIVISFINHIFPELWDNANAEEVRAHAGVINTVNQVEKDLQVPVVAVTTGPRSEHYIETV